MRTFVLYRALPMEQYTGSGDPPPVLAPGEPGVPAMDQYGFALSRLVVGTPPRNWDGYATPPPQWCESDAPGGGVRSVCNHVGVPGRTHYVTSLSATINIGAAAVPVNMQLQLRASVAGGSGTRLILNFGNAAMLAGDTYVFTQTGLRIEIPVGEDSVWQFTVAPGANVRQSVAQTGFTI